MISNVYERYSKEMMRVGLEVMEVLGVALELERGALRKFFEAPNNSSILRLNYYPPCQQPGLTFGTGPHTDPTGLTLLHQDNVCGLQVLYEGAWFTVCPRPDALVVNIGDTLMVTFLTHELHPQNGLNMHMSLSCTENKTVLAPCDAQKLKCLGTVVFNFTAQKLK